MTSAAERPHAGPHRRSGRPNAPLPPCPSRPIRLPSMPSTRASGGLGVSQSTTPEPLRPLRRSISAVCELGARRECEPSVPCRSRCGSADGLALAPALHLCNHAHSRIACRCSPPSVAHPPHAPVSARCHCTPFAREDSIHETYACRQDAGQLRVATTRTRA